MSGRRYTDKKKRALLRKFERHGGTAAAFCRENGVGYHSFLGWRRDAQREAAEQSGPAQFVEVEVPREETNQSHPATGAAAVELVLGGGMVLRIYQGGSIRP